MGDNPGAGGPGRPCSASRSGRWPTGGVECGLLRQTSISKPLAFVGGVGLLTVALTLGTKAAMARPDPHGLVVHSNGGSFPSGHTVAVMVCLGVAVLLMHPRGSR